MSNPCPICPDEELAGRCRRCGFSGRPLSDGAYECENIPGEIQYPESGNDSLASIEEESFWFAHRNAVIEAAARRRPWEGTLLDVGGGNGFQARMLMDLGRVVLVEPGPRGCANALARGVGPVVRGTLESLALRGGCAGGVALFDVLEHLDDRVGLLESAFRVLRSSGRLYVTVPSLRWLWSAEDDYARHKIRFTAAGLRSELARQGFAVEWLSYFFMPLVAPMAAFRVLPYRLGFAGRSDLRREHGRAGALARPLAAALGLELAALGRGISLPIGSSLVAVARKP